MQTNQFPRQAADLLRSLYGRFAPAVVPPTSAGHDPRWREQQAERGVRERALFQLRVLGWPGA